ncbi:MAG: hypothetical protein LJE67_14960 [Salaquimonas sp.]|nr:hypothetical protein [Salaquimonas sp.]
MRVKFLPLAFAAVLALALPAATVPSQAGELLALAAPNASQATGKVLDFGSGQRYALNACGLCTDVDCCGGAENGWKLCKSDCPSGQYRCEQVAVCE